MTIKRYLSHNSRQRAITACGLVIAFWALFFYFPPIIFSITVCAALCIMLIELKNMIQNTNSFFALCLFYPITPCCILLYFNHTLVYKSLLFYLIVLVFTFDSASYFTGKLWGKYGATTKIIPSISPGKSWQGACGGYIATTLLLYLLLLTEKKAIDWRIVVLSAMICIIAFLGDIFESYLKRAAQIKDSGTILPGHGGLLDRFDAILAVAYFFFICKDTLIKIF